ncbi:MAG: phosphoglycerate kinase [Patescibacteria group bacterium]|nr:phosphoglycerate kinase [Patescibacteria group bacterium]
MRSIFEQKGNLKNKKVLLRLDLNVPVVDGVIVDNFKIEKILTTIGFLKKEGSKIIILSHIGRDGSESLLCVSDYLKKFFEIIFIKDIFNYEQNKKISNMQSGDIVLIENIRQFREEKENDNEFSKKISSLGDIYVNEAFAASHRKHSSIIGLPKFMESFFGPVFINEVEELKRVFQSSSPKLFILGGNKLKTKIPFIRKFLDIADVVFVGGALANDVFKSKGFDMRGSLTSGEDFDFGNLLENEKVVLPTDVLVEKQGKVSLKSPNEVLGNESIMDAGPKTISELEKIIKKSKFILWNGPLGYYTKGFSDATFDLIRLITESNAESIAGGGDTEHCISNLGLEDKFDFISTGGGAMLEFISEGTLVGVEAIEGKK